MQIVHTAVHDTSISRGLAIHLHETRLGRRGFLLVADGLGASSWRRSAAASDAGSPGGTSKPPSCGISLVKAPTDVATTGRLKAALIKGRLDCVAWR